MLLFLSDQPSPEQEKYARILFDFRYLKSPETFEGEIERDLELVDLDEEFRDNHLSMLERFYQMFESVFRYVQVRLFCSLF